MRGRGRENRGKEEKDGWKWIKGRYRQVGWGSEAVGATWSKCPLTETCSPAEGETAVWPARTESTWGKNDKYFMRAFEECGFIIVGLWPLSPAQQIYQLVTFWFPSASWALPFPVCLWMGTSPRQHANEHCAAIWKCVSSGSFEGRQFSLGV